MIGFLLFVILLVLTIMRFYKNRALFSKLTKKEWVQYIAGMITASAVAIFITLGGINVAKQANIGAAEKIVSIGIILLGLCAAGFIFNKMIPEKIKSFYS